jgi:release factor glutamine methyltransferase
MRRNKINSCTFIQTFNFLQKQIPNISNNEIISILAKSSKKVKDALTFTQYRNTNIDFDLSKLKPIIHAIKNKQPIELILNKPIKYMDIKIDINNRVFIPRVETQEVIIHAIKLIKKEKPKTVIDLCCGSGVIGLMIKKKCKNIDVTCNDINHKCINLTKKNAKNNYLQIRTNCQDCYEFLRQRKNKAEFIIMNPPYLAKNEVTNELIKYEEKISFNNAKNGY